MKFSVLIPVYKVERYLDACLHSVLDGTFSDFEIIAVDDGSPDRCPEMLDAYARDYPEHVRVIHKENGGLICARRTAIKAARGEYIVFLDSDDALRSDALKVLSETFDATNADMVIHTYTNIYETGKAVDSEAVFPDGTVFEGREKERLYAELIRSWRLNNLWIKAIRRTLVQEDPTDYSPYYRNPMAEDLLQTLYPVTHAEKIVYRAEPLYLYNRRSDSISAVVMRGEIEKQSNEAVMALLREYMQIWGMDTPEWLRAYHSRRLFNMLSLFWQHYRAAKTEREKRRVILLDWMGLLNAEDRRYFYRNDLKLSNKLQLIAIRFQLEGALDLFVLVGSRNMRARHAGE